MCRFKRLRESWTKRQKGKKEKETKCMRDSRGDRNKSRWKKRVCVQREMRWSPRLDDIPVSLFINTV